MPPAALTDLGSVNHQQTYGCHEIFRNLYGNWKMFRTNIQIQLGLLEVNRPFVYWLLTSLSTSWRSEGKVPTLTDTKWSSYRHRHLGNLTST